MENRGMFIKKCSGCGINDVFVYARDKTGELPKAFCGKVCEANAKYNKRFDKRYE